MLQSLVQLTQLIMLHTSEIIILRQLSLRSLVLLLVVLFNSDGYGEIKQCPLKVSHMIVALSSQEECFVHRRILVASLTEADEGLLKLVLVSIALFRVGKVFFVDLGAEFACSCEVGIRISGV